VTKRKDLSKLALELTLKEGWRNADGTRPKHLEKKLRKFQSIIRRRATLDARKGSGVST